MIKRREQVAFDENDDDVSSIWGQLKSYLRRIQRIWPLRMLDRKWRDQKWCQSDDRKWHHRKSRDFFPCFSPVFFPVFCSCTFNPKKNSHIFFLYFFPPYCFPVLFSHTFSNVATFEIQRFKKSVSCFSRICRYSTGYAPCGIFVQTSPVGLPLEGWGARMRDLKVPKMNLFYPKEDWNVL
jgi:hypothetical protein